MAAMVCGSAVDADSSDNNYGCAVIVLICRRGKRSSRAYYDYEAHQHGEALPPSQRVDSGGAHWPSPIFAQMLANIKRRLL